MRRGSKYNRPLDTLIIGAAKKPARQLRATVAVRYRGFAPSCYGELERLAGVSDRVEFWHGKTEEQAREELRERIAARVANGELTLCYDNDFRQELKRRRRLMDSVSSREAL